MKLHGRIFYLTLFLLMPPPLLFAQYGSSGSELLDRYFARQVVQIEEEWRDFPQTRLEWQSGEDRLRTELKEMLGLLPEPPRGDLQVQITGTHEREGVIVENVVFQSVPGLYVTANLYRPAGVTGRLPAVLYVCGHATVKEDGIAYGSKVNYRRHPVWFARHGYVSLILDTLQLGEIEGLHHGTYREGLWWWINRGYTPAGVEAWNAIRAVDYLQSRADVDPERIAMTGRSGGGITTWWAGALDERITVAVPVAGLADLHSHIVDGVIEGHCDCMYQINLHRWSFSTLAALLAPRPLLLANSDKDPIFPLDGVLRIHRGLRHIYEQVYDAREQLALTITPGPHQDTQEIRVPAFHWIDRWLKGEEQLIRQPATPLFTPQELKVFDQIPEDQLNTRISELFVPKYEAQAPPSSLEEWGVQRNRWIRELEARPFSGWPRRPGPLHTEEIAGAELEGRRVTTYRFSSQPYLPLHFWVVETDAHAPEDPLIFIPLGQEELPAGQSASESVASLQSFLSAERLDSCARNETCVFFAPTGVGPTAWDPEHTTHIRRRFALLGQSLDAMRAWDIRRALQAIREVPELADAPIEIRARGETGLLAVYASIWEPGVKRLLLSSPPSSHRDGPILPFVSRILDVPQALGLLLPERSLVLQTTAPDQWNWLQELARGVGGDLRLE